MSGRPGCGQPFAVRQLAGTVPCPWFQAHRPDHRRPGATRVGPRPRGRGGLVHRDTRVRDSMTCVTGR